MCGLAGFWQPAGDRADALTARVRGMAERIAHRGPDDTGEWVDAATGVALGFRRLAIVDLSPTGHQPMRSGDGRLVLAYNGEIYNYLDLRAGLESQGVAFRGTSDTEVILELAARRGVGEMVRAAWGMFAMAVWDADRRVLWLARDRLGKKPLYYARGADGTWIFGSELKSLRAHPACPGEVDRPAVASLLRYGCIPATASIYTGIHKLPPGSLARLDADGRLEIEPYWRARTVVEAAVARRRPIADDDAIEACDRLLRDAVRRRMMADVPVGAFLSGGIDSSLVVALMQAESTRQVRTFAIGFTDPAYDEAPAAAAVARHLGTDHTEFYVTPEEALAVIPRLPAIYDEPFADSSQIPTYVVSSLARRHVTVALTGDGGDEMFGGYPRHVLADRVWRRVGAVPGAARRLAAGALDAVPSDVWNTLFSAVRPILPPRTRQVRAGDRARRLAHLLGAPGLDGLYDVLVTQWVDAERVVEGAVRTAPWAAAEARGLAVASAAERVMFEDLVWYLPEDILVKADRASMAVSLELRAPLLDHRLVDFSWELPHALRIRDGRGKWLLRRVLDRYVPAPLVDRPKTGFMLPVGPWLRGPLRDWAEALLSPAALADAGLVDVPAVRAVWARHLAARSDETARLWPVLMLQGWLAGGRV
ncbi:MAG: asparagine synthase (glutamine-hydrolyzing) [Vicinamibacterales bacterium]